MFRDVHTLPFLKKSKLYQIFRRFYGLKKVTPFEISTERIYNLHQKRYIYSCGKRFTQRHRFVSVKLYSFEKYSKLYYLHTLLTCPFNDCTHVCLCRTFIRPYSMINNNNNNNNIYNKVDTKQISNLNTLWYILRFADNKSISLYDVAIFLNT